MKNNYLTYVLYFVFTVGVAKAQSPYEEEITLPTYDESNSEMLIIRTNSDWSHINDADKRYFFVEPGDYSGVGFVKLTASGTSDKKRYIVLHNGNNTHPGKLDRSELAKIGFVFDNADYWVIDRMAYWDEPKAYNPIQVKNSNYNIINRYYMHDVGNGIYIYPGSDNNTVQNCRIERDDISIYHDRAAIGLSNNRKDNIAIKNTKLLNNEIYNFVDGIQTIRLDEYNAHNNNYEGTIIDYNHIYIDTTIYTNGKGKHDPDGDYAYAENALDLKVGSDNPDNPIIVTNNIMWGFRESDRTNSDLADGGAIMPVHYDVNNVIIENNISFNSTIGFSIADAKVSYSMANSKISNNVFYDIKKHVIYLAIASNILFEKNLYKKIGGNYRSYWMECHHNSDIKFLNNITVDGNNCTVDFKYSNYTSTNNEYFLAKPGDIADGSDVIHTSDPTVNYEDFVFTTDRYTNSPREITIPKIKPVSTGYKLIEKGSEINVYPNPTTGKILIEGANIEEIEFIDISGKYYSTNRLGNENGYDLSGFPKGLYFVKITTKTGVIITKKFMLQ
ncbi:MAG: T9SS type A sorting domain-containing protein [Draconibacterium sp.]|nr:T9SS type A sorting domain-containing protein [Draconibacterium sp.]